tara:strand:- start:23172 stop:23615 length:444 start_codon:yes stop_codon:yes gene_type:complete
MSTKKTVITAIETALKTISGIGDVVQVAEGFTQVDPDEFPNLYIKDEITERERIAFPASSNTNINDMQALLSLEIRGRVFSITDELVAPLDSLLENVEKTLVSSTGVSAVVKDIYPVSDVSDEGVQDNFASMSQMYEVQYFYNHANP